MSEWQLHDLEDGKTYESRYLGMAIYRGVDVHFGEHTLAFKTEHGMRYTKPEKLNSFLAPRAARSSANEN